MYFLVFTVSRRDIIFNETIFVTTQNRLFHSDNYIMENKATIISTTIIDCTEKPLNNKWGKCLDDYNNYTKEYIKHYKKSLQGNSISLSIYPYMKARSQALYEELLDAQDLNLLTESQIKRIYKIQILNPLYT